MIVLAIDVGMRISGYVICKLNGRNIELIKEAEIKPAATQTIPKKLSYIYDCLSQEVARFNPSAVLLETLYAHYRHPATLGLLAQIKGIVNLLAETNKIRTFECSTTRARKSFIGHGNANSTRVKKMAQNITGKVFKSVHTADAYSLVTAFAHEEALTNAKKRISA